MDTSDLMTMDTAYRWDLPWPRLLVPAYKEMNLGDWSIRWLSPILQWRYFHAELITASQYALLLADESWMSTAPVEVEQQAHHVAAAYGHVVVMGAGMGVALYNILLKPEVTRITLVERDPRVIDLLRIAADLDRWAGIDKLSVEIVDAFAYRPTTPVDHLYIDIWAKAADPRSLTDTQQLQHNVRAKTVGWWTQEFFFLQWLEPKHFSPTLDRYRVWAREIDLPLIEQDHAEYIDCIARLQGSWFYQNVLQQIEHEFTEPTGN
jgi:hypothetical protein